MVMVPDLVGERLPMLVGRGFFLQPLLLLLMPLLQLFSLLLMPLLRLLTPAFIGILFS